MSATQEWIKEKFSKESPRIITEYSLQKQVDELYNRVKHLEQDMAYNMKDRINVDNG